MKSLPKFLLFLAMAVSSQAASLTFTAGLTRNGFDELNGDDLGVGNLVRLGFFDISDVDIAANFDNFPYLTSHFTTFDTHLIGDGGGPTPDDGHISASYVNTNPGTVAALTGAQVYVWTTFSSDISTIPLALATVQQSGIMYFPKAMDTDWAFPDDLTAGRSPSLRDLTVGGAGDTLDGNAHLVVGTFGPGTSDVSSKPNFTLVAVPEPGTASLLAVGLLAAAVRRRRS